MKVSKSDPFGMGAAAANPDLRSSHFDCATVIVKARPRARDKLPTQVLLGPLDTHPTPPSALLPAARRSHSTLGRKVRGARDLNLSGLANPARVCITT